MKKRTIAVVLAAAMAMSSLAGCSGSEKPADTTAAATETTTVAATEMKEESTKAPESKETEVKTEEVVSSDLTLGDYEPKKKEYNFYLTYKLVHAWWDAVGLGLEEAQKQYADRGITINYEYTAPVTPDAIDQVNRLEEAAGRGFDVIGVDVNDIKIVTPTINNLIDQGVKVMTFSSSDATKEDGCKRIAYVGNTHNYQDGADLAEILAEKIDYKGQVAALAGTIGAPCHEDRIKGFKDEMV